MFIIVRATLAVLGLILASTCAIAVDAKYYKGEYGNMAKATRVDVAYEGKQLTFTAMTAATRSRVLVAASSEMAAKASSGVLRNLAAGLIGRRLDPKPFRLAALKYLAQRGEKKCDIRSGGQVTETSYEVVFECSRVPLPGFKR